MIGRTLLMGVALGCGCWGQDVPPPARFPAPAAGTPVGQAEAGREAAAGVATLRIGTRIVVLDVVVTDRKGKLVRGLTRDDFTVLENGKAQALRSFDGPEAHVQPADVEVNSSADLKRIGDAPVTVLVLDALNTKFEDMAFARQALIKFLLAQPARLAQPMVLMMATDTRFRLLHDYTQNRAELIEAVKKAPAEIPYKKAGGRNGPAAVERMAQSLASLEQIAQASAGTPGRKNVVWVGEGFPSADVVGLDPKTAATIEAAVTQCTNMLLAARVTMYTINPVANDTTTYDQQSAEDLAGAGGDGPEPFAGAVQFESFAPSTGGKAFRSRNDLGNEVAEGIAAGSTYYTMAYRPSAGGDDALNAPAKYRHIRIVMKDPSLRAVTRDGYFPPTAASTNIATVEPPKQAAAQLQLDISSALNSALAYNGLEVKASRVGGNYVVQVQGAGLDWHAAADGKEATEATVMAAWYDAKDKLLGHAGRELTASRVAGSEGSAAFALPVLLPGAGVARVRLVVRDAVSGKMGTVDVKP